MLKIRPLLLSRVQLLEAEGTNIVDAFDSADAVTALLVKPAPLSVIESSHVVRDEMFVTLIFGPASTTLETFS